MANRESFLHLPDWINLINENVKKRSRKNRKEKTPILVIGNKSDLDTFAVSPKEIDNFIHKYNTYYIETSTQTKEGIFDSFYCIAGLMVGIGIDSEYFLSKDIIYRPREIPDTAPDITPMLTAKDLSNLSEVVLFQKLTCLVCKGEALKFTYICPHCNVLYCSKCAQTLSNMENACWVCNAPIDESKPVKLEKDKVDKETNKLQKASKKLHKIKSSPKKK